MAADARVRELLRRIEENNGTPDEVCRDCPELLAEVRERWEKLLALDHRLRMLFPSATDAGAPDGGGDVEPKPRFPGYDVADQLGSGGMGVVYRARDAASGRLVALKVVHPHLRRQPGFVERLTREAEIGRQVVHENVVRTIGLAADATRAASRQALVTEYVEGQTLRALLAEMGRVPEQLCRHVGREIAEGLAAIHAIGAVHRDVKPENVLITTGDVVKVMDLGVARLLDVVGSLSGTGAFVGSLRYAAPEQRQRGVAPDGRADLYALGLTLYELSTGRHPFASNGVPALHDVADTARPQRAGELNPQVSPFFEEVLATLLEADRDARFATAAEVAAVLDEGEESSWWCERSIAIRGATRQPPRRVRATRETSLHGRDAELTLLRDGFAGAARGEGRVVLIEGEAGVGKSRLVEEFVGLLRRRRDDIHIVAGGYAPGATAAANNVFTTAYREFLGDADLATTLERHLPGSPGLARAFAALLHGGAPPPDSHALTREALQTVFTRTTQSLAAECPAVVIIEDLHLAPEEGRALFAALTAATPGHRVLLVGTARRTIDARWVERIVRYPHASRFELNRLGRHDLTALLCDALRSAQAAEDLAPELEHRSGGNPYFALELLRGLRESGVITRSVGAGWTAAHSIRDVSTPASITDLISTRVTDLTPDEREALEVAACCGFEFDPAVIGELLGLGRLALLRLLEKLESGRRLVRSAGRTYVFDHHQVHEVIYAGLPQARRETCHAAIGAFLERSSGAAERDPRDLGGALCVDLAQQFLDGAEGGRALRYLDAAIDHLVGAARNEAAVRLLDRALELPGLLTGPRRGAHLLRLGQRLSVCGRSAEEARVLREACALADDVHAPPLQAEVRDALGVHLVRVGSHREALALLAESAALYERIEDKRGEASAVGNVGNALAALGRHDEARAHFQRRLDLASAVADRRTEAGALTNLGSLALAFGRPDEAQRHLERSVAICRELGDRHMEARAAGNLGNVFSTLGRFADAQAQYEANLAWSREVGDRLSETRALGNLAINLAWVGRFAEAQARGERCLVLSRECASRTSEAVAAMHLGALLSSLGVHAAGQTLAGKSLEIAREIGSRRTEAMALGRLASCYSDGERSAEARALFEQQLALARAIGDRDSEASALASLGAADVRGSDTGDAARRLDEATAIAREAGFASALLVASAARACLPASYPQATVGLMAELGERVDVRSQMRAHWLLWRATARREHLAKAGGLLDFLVAHAPPDCRKSMIDDVRLHRDIRTAACAPPTD